MAILTKQYTHGPENVSENATWSATLPSDFSRIISCDAQYTISGNRITFTTKGSFTSYSAYVYENVWVSELAPGVPCLTEDPKDCPGHYERKLVRRTKYGYRHSATITYSDNAKPSVPSYVSASEHLETTKPVTVSWGASKDPEGSTVTYKLYANYGDSTTPINLYTGTATTYQYQMPSGVSSVVYSVCATDGEQVTDFIRTNSLTVISNAAPTITGKDEQMESNGSSALTYDYKVNDADNDVLVVTETLNGQQIKKLTNAPNNQTITAKVTVEQLREIPTGQSNTLVIQVTDTQGQSAFRKITFVKTNTPPSLSISGISDQGTISAPPTVNITSSDADGEDVTVKVYLDGKLTEIKELKSGTSEYAYKMANKNWITLNPKNTHLLKITAEDPEGSVTTKSIVFTRKIDKIEIKAVYKSEKLQKVVNRLYVTMQWMLDDGVVPTIKMCNNALDDKPTWEDVTKQILENTDVILANSTKTNVNWAIGVHVVIKRGTSDGPSWLGSIGGAIKEA